MERSHKLSEQLSNELINHPLSQSPMAIYMREYNQREEAKKKKKEREKLRRKRPEVKEHRNKKMRDKRALKKLQSEVLELPTIEKEIIDPEQKVRAIAPKPKPNNPLLVRCGGCLKITGNPCQKMNCKFEESKSRSNFKESK